MTVSSQTRGITFTGTGSASPFPLPFRFFNNSEITAYLVEDNGALTLLSQGVDYTLTGAGEPEIDGGAIGTLTKTVPLAIGKKMYVARTLPAVQQTDIVNQGEFFASLHEDVFDRLTMVDQQHAEELSRCVKTSPTDAITPDQLLANIKASENSAAASAASASASATSAAASFDDFDDRYLGAKSSDPATDNDGQPLIVGALYWSTPLAKMKAWDGSAWAFWSGDISGPAISTDTAIAIFDGTNGKLVKSSTAKVTAAGEVVTNSVQVGQSGTASNNFHWRNLLGGLLRLSRGNAGSPITDVMRVKADNSVEFPGGCTGSADDEKRRCTAWVNFNGTGTVAIRDSYNVSSITDNGTGDYTVNFAAAMANANYQVSASVGPTNGSTPNGVVIGAGPALGTNVDPTTAGFRVLSVHAGATLVDIARIGLSVFGGK